MIGGDIAEGQGWVATIAVDSPAAPKPMMATSVIMSVIYSPLLIGAQSTAGATPRRPSNG
jgi:hypothetical protein